MDFHGNKETVINIYKFVSRISKFHLFLNWFFSRFYVGREVVFLAVLRRSDHHSFLTNCVYIKSEERKNFAKFSIIKANTEIKRINKAKRTSLTLAASSFSSNQNSFVGKRFASFCFFENLLYQNNNKSMIHFSFALSLALLILSTNKK